MARMTLKAVYTDDERRQWPLSERIIDENLGSYHYVTHNGAPRKRRELNQNRNSGRRSDPIGARRSLKAAPRR